MNRVHGRCVSVKVVNVNINFNVNVSVNTDVDVFDDTNVDAFVNTNVDVFVNANVNVNVNVNVNLIFSSEWSGAERSNVSVGKKFKLNCLISDAGMCRDFSMASP